MMSQIESSFGRNSLHNTRTIQKELNIILWRLLVYQGIQLSKKVGGKNGILRHSLGGAVIFISFRLILARIGQDARFALPMKEGGNCKGILTNQGPFITDVFFIL